MDTFVVKMKARTFEVDLPSTNEERALRWMREFIAANPGCSATVYAPNGEVVASAASAERQ